MPIQNKKQDFNAKLKLKSEKSVITAKTN